MLRVVSLNEQANHPTGQVVDDLLRVLQDDPDLIGFQEIGGKDRARVMRRILRKHGYGFIVKHRFSNAQSVPLAWKRKRFKHRLARSWKLSRATRVGRRGAGPAVLREKWMTWTLLHDKHTGKEYAFGNCHLAPSIYIPVRAELHEEQVAAIADWAEHMREINPHAIRIVTMDANTQREELLRPIGLRAHHAKAGTHGKAHIDWVLSDAGRVGAHTIERLNTDHDALVVDLHD